jgi:hypothetical protein
MKITFQQINFILVQTRRSFCFMVGLNSFCSEFVFRKQNIKRFCYEFCFNRIRIIIIQKIFTFIDQRNGDGECMVFKGPLNKMSWGLKKKNVTKARKKGKIYVRKN